ncbi:MAG: SAM-dependent methyltransferase [Frondihabitans sp.]|nr:SAM-dependent methyltransferase [Frondihabitans sp.]
MRSDLITSLRRDLAASLFTVARLETAWGAVGGAALFRGEKIAARRALDAWATTSEAERASRTLAKLFILGYPQPAADVAAAFPGLGLDGAADLELIGVDGDEVHPLVDLRPYSFVDTAGEAHWWVASDLGELALQGPLREDHVLGIGGASTTLSGLMIPRPVDRALDLGTGCGIQAMHAARHARHVVATDISARALEFGRFNAELNLIDGIEWRLGSLFEPVAGETFDHIVSNPPFVITPRVEGVPSYEYRDGGMVGDALVATVVAQAGAHLTPGGVAQLLGNWETGTGVARGAYSVADWVRSGGVPLDVWVVERETQDPTSYAETWIRDGGTRPGTPGFGTLYEAWLDDFAARGVSEVGFGYVTLRKPQDPAAPVTERIERLLGSLGSNDIGLGSHVLACLEARDQLRTLSDDDLLASHLTAARDVTEERHYWPGNDDPTVITLRQGGGFARSIESGTALSALVGACDGELAVGPIIGALSQLLEADDGALRAELLPRVRELVADGLLRQCRRNSLSITRNSPGV